LYIDTFRRFRRPVEAAAEGGLCLSRQLPTTGTELRASQKPRDETR